MRSRLIRTKNDVIVGETYFAYCALVDNPGFEGIVKIVCQDGFKDGANIDTWFCEIEDGRLSNNHSSPTPTWRNMSIKEMENGITLALVDLKCHLPKN